MAKETLVVEFDADNRNPFLPHLDRSVRGRFDAQALIRRDKEAGSLVADWPDPIPGQQLAIDMETGEAAIVEPLHDPRFKAIADKLKARNLRLPPAREAVSCDLPTLLYFTRDAIKTGQAKIVAGKIPEFDESKARRNFITQPTEDPQLSLATALTAQAAAFNRLADVLERALAKK